MIKIQNEVTRKNLMCNGFVFRVSKTFCARKPANFIKTSPSADYVILYTYRYIKCNKNS